MGLILTSTARSTPPCHRTTAFPPPLSDDTNARSEAEFVDMSLVPRAMQADEDLTRLASQYQSVIAVRDLAF